MEMYWRLIISVSVVFLFLDVPNGVADGNIPFHLMNEDVRIAQWELTNTRMGILPSALWLDERGEQGWAVGGGEGGGIVRYQHGEWSRGMPRLAR